MVYDEGGQQKSQEEYTEKTRTQLTTTRGKGHGTTNVSGHSGGVGDVLQSSPVLTPVCDRPAMYTRGGC